MRRTIPALLALLLALAAAGCGGGDDEGATPTLREPGPLTEEPEATRPRERGPEDEPGGAGDEKESPERPEARERPARPTAEACKKSIDKARVSDDLRSELERVCEEAASGDEEALKEATREACRKLVDEANIRDGKARQQALSACDRPASAPLEDR